MAISVEYATKIITIPQADLTFLSGSNYQLDINDLHIWLRDWEDSENGMMFPKTHTWGLPVTLLGIQYAPIFETLNGYTYTFSEEASPYAVTLIGANNDVLSFANLGTVQILGNNSAGLVNLVELQYGAYDDGVTYNSGADDLGTGYPSYSQLRPGPVLVDAQTVAVANGFDNIYLNSDLTVQATESIAGYNVYGKGSSLNTTNTVLTFVQGAGTSKSHIYDCKVTGYQSGEGFYTNCAIDALENSHCLFQSCLLLDGTATGYTIKQSTGPGNSHTTLLRDCTSDEGVAIIDRDGARMSMLFDGFHGQLEFKNNNHADAGDIRVHMKGGKVTVGPTNTTGRIYLTGDFDLDPTVSSGGTQVFTGVLQSIDNVRASVESQNLTHKALGHTIWVDHESGTDTNTGDSDITPVKSFGAAFALADQGDAIQVIPPITYGFVHREDILLNLDNVHIRGAGRAVVYKPLTNGEAVLQVGDTDGTNGYECSFKGMLLDGDRGAGTASSVNVIKMYGKFTLMEGMWAKQSEGSLCKIYGGDYHRFNTVEFEKSDSHLIETEDLDLPSGSPREIEFRGYNNLYLAAGDAIHLGADLGEIGSTTRIINILDGNIHSCDGYAVHADADVDKLLLGNNVIIHDNNGGHGNPQNNILTTEVHNDRTEHQEEQASAVWDEVLTGATHNIPSSAGRRLRSLGGVVGGVVTDVAATTTEFKTDLTAVDGFYNDQLVHFTSGALEGQARPILEYYQTDGRIVFDEPLTSAPADTDDFDIIADHIHPLPQIAESVWTHDPATTYSAGQNRVQELLLELAQLNGLDISNPLTVTPSSRDTGALSQDITGDPQVSVTVTRK